MCLVNVLCEVCKEAVVYNFDHSLVLIWADLKRLSREQQHEPSAQPIYILCPETCKAIFAPE